MDSEEVRKPGANKLYVGIIIVLAVAVVLVGSLLVAKTLNPGTGGTDESVYTSGESGGTISRSVEVYEGENGEPIVNEETETETEGTEQE